MKRKMIATVLMLATTSSVAWAQAPAPSDPHHPSQRATPAPAPAQPTPPSTQSGPGGMPMMDMMSGMPAMMNRPGGAMPMMNMMPMIGMMRMMEMTGHDMGGMATIDRVEGRIAFLRTELKVTDAQAATWNAFAEALRTNAKKLGEVRASMMARAGSGQQQGPTIVDRLDLQEQWLVARLEGTRAIKTAVANLYGALSDDQKKTADELLAPHMGMGMMMMQGQMQPGQMQPGQMQPGQMRPGQMQPPQAPQPAK